MTFRDKLWDAMVEMNLSQADVVRLTGCSKGSISMYLNNKNVPSAQKQKGIAIALGLQADYFEDEEPEIREAVKPSDKSGIHRISLSDLAKTLGVDKETARAIAINRELPGCYGCKASGDNHIFIINEAIFCQV